MRYEDLFDFINIPTLYTDRLILRRLKRSDVDDVYEYSSDPAVSQYLMWSPHSKKAVSRRYLKDITKKYKTAEFYTWGIEFEGRIVGTVGFNSFNLEYNSAEVGYVISSKYWRLGFATEALRRILKYGFLELNLNRIEIRYMSQNTASLRVAEKCGLRLEGVMKDGIFVKGSYRDVGIAAITRELYDGMR